MYTKRTMRCWTINTNKNTICNRRPCWIFSSTIKAALYSSKSQLDKFQNLNNQIRSKQTLLDANDLSLFKIVSTSLLEGSWEDILFIFIQLYNSYYWFLILIILVIWNWLIWNLSKYIEQKKYISDKTLTYGWKNNEKRFFIFL